MNSNINDSKGIKLDIETDEEINLTEGNKISENQSYLNFSSIQSDKKLIILVLIILCISVIVFLFSLNFIKITNFGIEFFNPNNNDIVIKNEDENGIFLNNITLANRKLKIAFVYSTLYANGIARFITVAANYFVNTGKYEVYIITEGTSKYEYKYDNRITRIVAQNKTITKDKTKNLGIDFFILQNVSGWSTISFYKSIGKFVIGMFHGLYMSQMFHGKIDCYKTWNHFDNLDAFIFIGYDDYFFYKKLGFKNEIFIPNFYTFEPSKIKSSELKGHNIVMLGRAADKIKGIIYAIKAMPFIVKEVPDAKLILLSSSYSIQFLRDLAKELKVDKNINFNYYTEDISKVFWDSSVLMYTSLSEAFPLAMVEGKAHGLPVVAFDVACSPPYQSGVINVDMLDCEALANETVKLLKNEEYRKQKGKEAKLSLEHFNNVETEQIWEKLFKSLMKGNRYFREFQKEIEEKYYDEDKARIRMEKRYRDVLKLYKNFTCHTLNDFTRLSYVKHIKPCPNISESDNNK